MKYNNKLNFHLIIFFELLFLPILIVFEELKKICSSNSELKVKKVRKKIESENIYINIHEWGGYNYERKKEIKNIKSFVCGLKYQLIRFKRNQCKYKKILNVTISDHTKFRYLDEVLEQGYHVDFVSNNGMDFSGYDFFYNKIKTKPNAFVILTNSSVNKEQTLFLNDYIHYMENNTDVGILGVSYCAKKMQTLVKNNFTPHLQSFFLLTTINVLNEIVEANNNKFPGAGIDHKLMLIRKGEIKFSSLAMKLGYNLGVTLENGSVIKFGKNSKFDNGYKRWSLKNTDVRMFVQKPNLINEIS